MIEENMSLIGTAAILVSIFPLLGIALTLCMATNIAKAKYEQMA